MRITVLLTLGVALVGCGAMPELIVDHTGIDEGRYSRDLADCTKHRAFVTVGHPDADCIRSKGYKVLVAR